MNTRYDVIKLSSSDNATLKPIAINDNSQILCISVIGEPSFWSDNADGFSFALDDTSDFNKPKSPNHAPFASPGRHALLIEGDHHTVRDLGMFTPQALNNSGHVAGYLAVADIGSETFVLKAFAVVWNGTKLLRLFDTPVFSQGSAINDRSEVAGTLDTPFETNECSFNAKNRKAFVWSNGNYSLIDRPKEYRIGKISGFNSHGMMVASVVPRNARKGRSCKHICLGGKDGWQFIELPKRRSYQSPEKLNNRNQVLCTSSSMEGKTFSPLCYLWDAGTLTPIGIYGKDLNDNGQVVGFNVTGELLDRRALLWQDGRIFDLNDYVPHNTGWTLHRADGINNQGQIVGRGTFEGANHAFLLTPTSL